jgi:hypothetical protein
MATKQTSTQKKSTDNSTEEVVAQPASSIAPSVVQSEPEQSFDERTQSRTPWLNEKGEQVNGSEDIEQGSTEPVIEGN